MRGRGRQHQRRGFTLVEMLMAMMVTGVILSSVLVLCESLAAYNYEGEAANELVTHARFALSSSRQSLQRNIRAARALGVSSKGGLVLWMGDLDDDERMSIREVMIFYRSSQDRTLRQVTFTGNLVVDDIRSEYLSQVMSAFDSGNLTTSCPAELGKQETVICRHVDSIVFRTNAAFPAAAGVEYQLKLSRGENRISGHGHPVTMSFYGGATMRARWKGNGFE